MRSRKRLSRAPMLVVMALVALTLMAIPGNATFAKKYDLTVLAPPSTTTPSPAVAGSQTAFTAKYTNKSLYKINSTVLTVPSGFQVVGTPTTTRGTISSTTTTSVSVRDLNLSLGSSFTISLSASVPCVAGTSSWTALTKTGNFSGSTFSLNNPGNAQKTTVSGSCNATIDVVKYEDSDLSGARGDGEGGLGGWDFTAYQGADATGPVVAGPQSTGPDGTTSFSVAAGTTYSVCETPQDGWTNTDPGGAGCETITLTSAGASLQFGNAEGAVGELACSGEGSTASAGGEGEPAAGLVRDENADGTGCVLVPYILETGTTEGGTGFVDFIKNLETQASAQFLLTIDWLPEPAVYPIPTATEVDYGSGPVNLNWCEPSTDPDRLYDLPPSTEGNPNLWCLVSQNSQVGSIAGEIDVTEVLYGLGDPRVTRG